MKKLLMAFAMVSGAMVFGSSNAVAQDAIATVTIENISPENGVGITPPWIGFHSGNFDSYNGGLRSLEALERVAEDGNNSLISAQFTDFDFEQGGYTFIDNSTQTPRSVLTRTGDIGDLFRQDGTIGSAPLLPGQSASEEFVLQTDGSNDFFSYVSMVLPTNDFFIANGNPTAHDISDLLANGGEIEFFIGTPNGGVNDAGTERENFRTSAANPLFPGRNLPPGQAGPNQGQSTIRAIANVEGNPFQRFRLVPSEDALRLRVLRLTVFRVIRVLRPLSDIPSVQRLIDRLEQTVQNLEDEITIDVDGLDFNQYQDGIARVTISVVIEE